MPCKRRNNGRSKKNRGKTRPIHCFNCRRLVPKDKAIKKYTVRDLVEASSKEDIKNVCIYAEGGDFIMPKAHTKLYYCVSCAIHGRVVRGRSRVERRKRKVLTLRKNKDQEKEIEKSN